MLLNKRICLTTIIFVSISVVSGIVFIGYFVLSPYFIKSQRLSEIEKQGWHKTQTPLWQDKDGQLGLKVKERISDSPDYIPRFITYFYTNNGKVPINQIVDMNTFEQLSKTFYQDTNHIYQNYDMSDGGYFYIFETKDKATFQVLNECFTKDKEQIYHFRNHDTSIYHYDTFRTCKMCWCLAKDKYGYYYYDEKIQPEQFLQNSYIDEETKNNLKTLMKVP